MLKKEIKFSLLYRDMWQSSGKYQPRVDQLKQIAPVIVDMGCFARVETNGGAFEQVNLLYGENPNTAVREFTAPFNQADIQTHMLDRGLNGLRMNPVPADVRQLMYRVKKAQGVDITRIFDGLNDVRNIIPSIQYAKEGGMIPQASLCITCSPIHTVDYYVRLADQLIEAGAEEICLKDMAGIGRPYSNGQIIKGIKDRHPNIAVQYHGHSGPGFSVASMWEAAQNGVDYIDVAMEPLAWGMVHPDIITIQAMLKDAGFLVPDINMEAYMEARRLTQTFMDDFLGYFIDPSNKIMTSLLVGCGLPGGMMGSMMADLKGMHNAINLALTQQDKPEVSLNNLVIQLFKEVELIWPILGYPPLVTPFSQYVKNIALMNIFSAAKDEPRFSMIDKDSWNMILGKMGKLPGKLSPEIVELAKANQLEFYEGNPQDSFPNELERFRTEMQENAWDEGPDQEELFEFAMHERQYRDMKTGAAKNRFNQELEQAKEKAGTPIIVKRPVVEIPMFSFEEITKEYPFAKPVHAPIKGQLIWQYDLMDASTAPFEGSLIDKGDNLCYIQNIYGIEPVKAGYGGTIVGTYVKQGDQVEKGQILAFIN
ncbi:MAG: pyruvate carboxylase subunit B [Candidatus Ordinivivax streblomastigis]|uniref:Pyruvate carboxylase subunit B n=1 Tax=Candidatus Ordinivivax streblomastigis TaxID=2540710 RepID=A0A5M8NVW9_9BACT|nr:MAG: pyruvate carboxylase subunit B [Candidatus Ordinivivax streblomastigis]